MKNHITSLIVVLSLVFFTSKIHAQPDYVPAPENLENRDWFQDAKFGLFIHWGPYSVLGVHEWVMETQKIDKQTYEKLGDFFNPVNFDPAEWVAMAKDAGMKYITITAKHHDGFAMYDSDLTDWDIVDRSTYGKDILKQLAEACRKEGIKLFFYYSQLDWNHPDYYPRGQTGESTGRPESGNWDKYIDYMNGQLSELLTNYGDVAGIWFDGWWDKPDANWRLQETYKLIHELQPGAMIGSNHHKAPKPGEDFQMFEKDLPGHNTAGYSEDAIIGDLPLETAETMAHNWGFSLQDKSYKSTNELIRYLVKAAGYNSNFLLNVGPMPNGKIQPEFVKTLEEVGNWTRKYGATIYGTRGGPIDPQVWGVTTQKDEKIYVHILNWQAKNFLLPKLEDKTIESIVSFDFRN
ncbi:MAG: alpha-L-fucosidase, partial [Gracilimonas sp.]